MAELPHGIPDVLYNFPSLYGTYIRSCIAVLKLSGIITGVENYKQRFCDSSIDHIQRLYSEEPVLVCSDFKDAATEILHMLDVNTLTNFYDALQAYFILLMAFQ